MVEEVSCEEADRLIDSIYADPWWWLTFADEVGFLGACLIQSPTFNLAVSKAHALWINPGGSVQGWRIANADVVRFHRGIVPDKLLSREEIRSA